MTGATGLDYAVVPLVARMLGIKLTPRRFAGLRVMEGAALDAMAGRRAR